MDSLVRPQMPHTPTLNLPRVSIVIADCVGRAHVTAGLSCHSELLRTYAAASTTGGSVDVPAVLNLAIPAITNLALGLEIFLKMHHFQNTGAYPTGHEIGSLATSFEPKVQDGLNRVFLTMLENERVQSAASLNISVGEKKSDLAAIWPEEAANLKTAARLLGRAYERWRYIYEKVGNPLVATIAFKPLIAMVFTLDFAIQNFRSEAFIAVGEDAG